MSHRTLSATDLGFHYGDVPVLTNVSLTIPSGLRTAILGANGSGKTTLLRCLSGALRPETGQVFVDGVPVSYHRAGLTAHRQVVQLVGQDPDDQLFAADVFRDVSFGPMNLGLDEAEVARRVEDALTRLAITELADRPIHQLSFGQKKRVAIAGALAMHPCIVLLDEPTAGLDPQGVAEMVDALERLRAAQTSVVIATHEIDFALAWADRVCVVADGDVRMGLPVAMLGDAELIARARLRPPLILDLAARLGVSVDESVRDTTALAERLRGATHS